MWHDQTCKRPAWRVVYRGQGQSWESSIKEAGVIIQAKYTATEPGLRSRVGGESWWGGGAVREGYVEEEQR